MRMTPAENQRSLNIFSYLKRGRYFTQNCIKNSATYNSRAITANRIYAMPIYIGSKVKIDRLAVQCTSTIALSKARVGIYRCKPDITLPGNLLVQSTEFDLSTAGVKEDTGISVWLSGNRIYFLAFLSNSASTMKTAPIPSWFLGVHKVEDSTQPEIVQYLYAAQSYGSLPDPHPSIDGFGSVSTDGNEGPAIWFRTAP